MNQYERARHLFHPLHYQLAVESMLDGTNPGWVYVDDAEKPTCAWMVNSEGFFLAGNPGNKEFNAWLKDWFEDYVQHGNKDWESETVLLFDISSDEWVSSFPEVFSQRPPLEVNRMHYLCREVKVDWRSMLPEGFSVHRIDQSILESDTIESPEHLRFWIRLNWGSHEQLLKHGFGTCIIHENKMVSYSLADCVHREECEIGIQTLEKFRGRGLATVTAAANVELAFEKGFTVVGWHTHDYNKASQRTAEKVGFELERLYLQYECHRSGAMHIAEKGLRLFMKNEHEQAVKVFEEAFEIGEVAAWVFVIAARSYARLGNAGRAIALLHRAADCGWSNMETMNSSDFHFLHENSDWRLVLGRISANSRSCE